MTLSEFEYQGYTIIIELEENFIHEVVIMKGNKCIEVRRYHVNDLKTTYRQYVLER
jgi:hypothetical protein